MRAFWLAWSPKGWPEEDLRRMVREWERRPEKPFSWSIAAFRQAAPGDRAYLFKQGQGERGVFGVGDLVGPPEAGPSWRDPNVTAHYAPIRFRRLERFRVTRVQSRWPAAEERRQRRVCGGRAADSGST